MTVTLKKKVGVDGKLFGAVTHKDITDAVRSALGVEIDKKMIRIDEPIKMSGAHTVTIHLRTGRERDAEDRGREGRIMAKGGKERKRDTGPHPTAEPGSGTVSFGWSSCRPRFDEQGR